VGYVALDAVPADQLSSTIIISILEVIDEDTCEEGDELYIGEASFSFKK
jgi:hypothetical protein